ncbi:DegT/DnrJ/EryC1/StrS family aminotransferase [Hymenobacter lucidus]|uniref:DegT/DnrJ/EryC1/StrS family aminotransferase n=1 Tax=Hymenobacter lucidus TaxID=2880930 RepID=A0ABS8AM40_9BACT|nr:DegT/DnrJ/EryC1/StrS family aminotransferase [Hymenobacter lucidus]MCB2407270.1 DegT/DnrJ/EryC1/StrS family aminotransferase [Hymenobacter lucidus]
MPPLAEYTDYLNRIWAQRRLTNGGPLAEELELELAAFVGNEAHVQLVANGTVALQLAIRALELTGEIITTPFSYVATTGSILWEKCTPVFVDIDESTFCLDAAKIEAAITPRTQAILATHVYGYPCDVVRIAEIAERHQLKVIYDGAHAFGTRVAGRSLLTYGDITACSFHATKLFHMAEGGALVTRELALAEKIGLLRTNGHHGDHYVMAGTNAKTSELNAALGLCLLPRVPGFIEHRAALYRLYREELAGLPLSYPLLTVDVDYNYAYFPVIFSTEMQLLTTKEQLAAAGVGTRRYFFPTLNALPYHTGAPCPVAEDISQRVLCLPFYQELTPSQVQLIAQLVRVSMPAEEAELALLCINE